jgi:heme exporter protein D
VNVGQVSNLSCECDIQNDRLETCPTTNSITFDQEDEVMGALDTWDVTLLVVASYLAVLALVRLMARQRDQLLGNIRQQFAKEKKRKEEENEDEERDWRKSA